MLCECFVHYGLKAEWYGESSLSPIGSALYHELCVGSDIIRIKNKCVEQLVERQKERKSNIESHKILIEKNLSFLQSSAQRF